MKEKKYQNLIDIFSKGEPDIKRSLIIKELKILLAVLEQGNKNEVGESNILISKHIVDDESDDSESEFLTKVFAYLKSIEELLGSYVLDIAELLEIKEDL